MRFRNSARMLSGLLFATHDAEAGQTLAATLPFGGTTLLEYQARLLQLAGASQIVVVVGRLTPELLGAVARIGRRGCTVDAVRTAGEAAAKMHPLARILMLADGLITYTGSLARVAHEDGDALLVLQEDGPGDGLERLGDGLTWAGIAQLLPDRLAEVAAMPRDYDIQSALLRTIAQAGGARVLLPEQERTGHGVQRHPGALEALGRTMIDQGLRARSGWFDRWLVQPVMRPLLALMMRRRAGALPLAAGTAVLALGGLLALGSGQMTLGLLAVLAAVIGSRGGETLADLRDEPTPGAALEAVALGFPLLAFLLLGQAVDEATAGTGGLISAAGLAVLAGLGEQAARGTNRPWWDGGVGGVLALVTLGTLVQLPQTAMLAGGAYAAVTLAGTIERLRA